jgi:chloramphenicol-sensitive protein RarD
MRLQSQDTLPGLAFAVSAYFLWGFLPLYLKMLDHAGPVEVVAHRIVWSVPVALAVLLVLRRTGDLVAALRSPSTLAMGAVTALLITCNWSIYVYSITIDKAIDAALGYYINPLFSIALAAVLLGERLTRLQLVAVGLAALGVAYLTWATGRLPLVALGLTVSWGFYAFCKRWLPVGPNQGFLLEVLILMPFALGYLFWLGPEGHFATGNLHDTALLIGTGVVTAVPLMLYANGAKGLRLSTIGILQYIAPTMIFLVAVFVFGEEFDPARRVAFPLIWAALVIYVWSMFRENHAARLRRI